MRVLDTGDTSACECKRKLTNNTKESSSGHGRDWNKEPDSDD